MQPTQLALVIHRGATFRARLRVMRPSFVYLPITAIGATAPVQLTVEHGLPTDWPVWISGVRQMPALNRAAPQQAPHFVRVVDANTLEINTINALGLAPQGGQIQYHPPLALTGATATLTLYNKGAEVGTLPVTVDAAGWVDVVLTDEQTEALDWTELQYTLDVQLGAGDVLRVYAGAITAVAAGTTPATCQGFAVIGADRGPPGPTVASADFDADGRLVIVLEDGTEIMTDPLNRPWGSIAGDITTQADLMALFGDKVDVDDYLAFVQQVTLALADRYTKLEADNRFDPINAASEAVSAHVALPDPHVQYALRVLNNTAAITDPSATDDSAAGYQPLSKWINTATNEVWTCLNAAAGAAVWELLTLDLSDLGTAATVNVGTADAELPNNGTVNAALNLKANTDDARFTDAREWTAPTVTQVDAEAGIATDRRAWTAQRVGQAIYAQWLSVTSSFGRSLVASADAAAGRTALAVNEGSPYAATSGTADALILTTAARYTPKTALAVGDQVRFRASSANTGAATINWDGRGITACRTVTNVALPAGYIRTDVDTVATFNGTFWILQREVERGSNGNGFFVRFADGTANTWRNYTFSTVIDSTVTIQGLTVYGQTVTWNYPINFANPPTITPSSAQNVAVSISSAQVRTITGSSCTLELSGLYSHASFASLKYVSAVGTWY